MTDITLQDVFNGVTTDGNNYLARFTTWCGQVAEGAHEGRRIAARYDALSRLSSHDLAGRGLTRQTMARAALIGD